jgi:hypothetical protein
MGLLFGWELDKTVLFLMVGLVAMATLFLVLLASGVASTATTVATASTVSATATRVVGV